MRRYRHEVQNFSEATPVGSSTSTVITGIDAAISRGDEILSSLPTVQPAPIGPRAKVGPHLRRHKLHCKKHFRRVTKGHHQRCVKVHKKKARHHPTDRKTARR